MNCRNECFTFAIRRVHARGHLGDELGESATADGDADDVAEELANGGKRARANALEVGHHGAQPRSDRARADHRFIDRGEVRLVTMRAVASPAAVFADLDRPRVID